MKVFYLHGLFGAPNPEKLAMLEAAGFKEVVAPHVVYETRQPNDLFAELYETCQAAPPDLLIGSSMGGYMTYWLSRCLNLPVLLLNPALNSRTDENYNLDPSRMPAQPGQCPSGELVVGLKDGTIPPMETLFYFHLEENKPAETFYQFWPDVAHQWPLPAFERAVRHSQLIRKLVAQ